MHILDLTFFLVYFLALVHYTVRPPVESAEPTKTLLPGLREAFIIVYASSQLCKRWEITIVPSILTLLAFLSCLPSIPRPQDGAYSVLLLAVSLQLLQLHLPRSPSPLLLLPFDFALPLATLVQHGIFKIFLPVITFFLPALLLAFFLTFNVTIGCPPASNIHNRCWPLSARGANCVPGLTGGSVHLVVMFLNDAYISLPLLILSRSSPRSMGPLFAIYRVRCTRGQWFRSLRRTRDRHTFLPH